MKPFSSKRRWITAAIILLVLMFLLRPGASRLKSRIIVSVSSGLGRSVDIGSVHVHLLPRPAFDLENLVVYDDTAFGAEPMLRATDVTAALRLMSLLRGRIEIARLDLAEPSLNMVRGENGHWNIETLLERTAHTPLAPTSKAKSGPRLVFPYIQATSARINFKNGQEKKPYALTNADFSLWQDSENAWGIRLKAQPVRTDLNLNDTGILQVSGTWQRALPLRNTPLQFSVEWDRAQIGQLTKLISGFDQGWRGGVQLQLTLQGTPAKLLISTDAVIDDFRRYDITSGDALRLAAHCDAQYSSQDRTFHDVLCNAPVRDGLITVKGSAGLPGAHTYDVVMSVNDVPAGALVGLARRVKKNLPEDLTATGTLRGTLSLARAGLSSNLALDGRGEIANLRLASSAEKNEIGPETVPLLLTGGGPSRRQLARPAGHNLGMPVPMDPHLELGPFPLPIGHVTTRGWMARSGYTIQLAGDSEIGKTLRAARIFGLPAIQAPIDGTAQVDLQIAGAWSGAGSGVSQGFSAPQVTGTAKLHNTRIPIRGTGTPVEITSADLRLLPDESRLEKLTAKVGNASWTGSLELPRGCGTPTACEIRFSLNANQLSYSDLTSWISPSPKERPWYRVLAPASTAAPLLASLRATGHVTVDHLQMHTLPATRVSADVTLDAGKLTISDLTADFAAGKYQGDWQADFTVNPPVSTSTGTFTRVSLAGLVVPMKDRWISGTASGSYQLNATGSSTAEFWRSAEATMRFDLADGELAHISLEDEGPLRISHMTGQARLHSGNIEAKEVKLVSPSGIFQITGTASLKHELELKLVRHAGGPAAGYAITGTLAQPRVQQLSGSEQARLKQQ